MHWIFTGRIPLECTSNGDLHTISEEGVYTSPGYQDDGNGTYSNDMNCTWILQAPYNHVTRLYHP